jgi:hypothetical protein
MLVMQVEPRNYASFLLRLRQVEQDSQLIWRATLESIQTGERRRFVNAQALTDFLLDCFGAGPSDTVIPPNDHD